jgi:hypothetical protein
MRRRRDEEDGGREIAELAALADGSLAPRRRAALEEQVAGSTELADRLAEQQRAVSLAQGAGAEVVAPAALRARIETQQRSSRARPARQAFVIGAGVAAAAAVAIAIVVVDSGTSREHLKAALGPTALDPGASGDATLVQMPSGWRITLEATGLPRLEGGRFYEGWLRNPSGVLVPIGTFNDGRSVTLWAGVSPKDFPTLTITRERADGNQTSSGQKVLVGTVVPGGSG